MKPFVLYLLNRYIYLSCMVWATNAMIGTNTKGSNRLYKIGHTNPIACFWTHLLFIKNNDA